jgi:hypothetical protein
LRDDGRVVGTVHTGNHSVRAATVLGTAGDPLLLRYHRQTQMHRAQRRRSFATTQKGAAAALRPASRRTFVLLHNLRLDDVELASQRPGLWRHTGQRRWQSVLSLVHAPSRSLRRGRLARFWHQRALPRILRGCRAEATRITPPGSVAADVVHGLTVAAAGLRLHL